MNYIAIPSTGTKLFDGTIVVLSTYPGTKWIVHRGWYSYQGSNYNGWYVMSIPTQECLPLSADVLNQISVISGGSDCGCHAHPPSSCPPPHGPHGPEGLSGKAKFQLDRAFITVDTIAERDFLFKNDLIPDGKIVKVNQTTTGTKYFSWNQVTQQWDIETFGIDTSNFLAVDDFDDKLVSSIQSVEPVKDAIRVVAGSDIEWGNIN